jgi:hypothetical protein
VWLLISRRVQQPLQISFIQDDHMVKQIPAAVAHPTLGNTVLPWTSKLLSFG